MSFISFLLVSFLIFWVLRLVLPYVLRYALSSFVRKQMRTGGMPFGADAGAFGQQAPPRYERPNPRPTEPTGEVRVDYVPPKAPRQPKKEFRGGDYVEFEEVK
ncbi:DUF4834 family protein [Hymenobacter jeollabukensis]|uniref:DUF4834 family protein n=1 Tax=Hymenobacter jeollabukensis TaxID=2025313 RepID=A0A5R8WVC6_9BACT|nr:DUF4834 family protein [Hymenobacter jeollabukensis]TLM95433.1 DUF4834 family protein [Hymenobacter jeollabukensis]